MDYESRCLMNTGVPTSCCSALPPNMALIPERFSRANHENAKLANVDSCAISRLIFFAY